MTTTLIFSTLVFTCIYSFVKCSWADRDFAAIEGDIILGGLFPIHKKSDVLENQCGEFVEIPGYRFMEGMLFAIEKVNKDETLLKNITLGAQIYDTCRSQTIIADRAREFIKMTIDRGAMDGQLAGVIGAFTSDASATVANFLRVFEIPQISPGSTSVTLSNKDIYSYFLRTVPPDSFQAQAMVDIIKRFGWSYVSAVNSAGNYGTEGMRVFLKKAKEHNICIDIHETFPLFPTQEEYKDVIKKLVDRASHSNLSVVVVFLTQADAERLLKAANMVEGSQYLTWIGGDDWTNGVENGGKAGLGSLNIQFHFSNVFEQFRTYFMNRTWNTVEVKNRFFKEFWEHHFNCSLVYPGAGKLREFSKTCTGNETLSQVKLGPVRVVIDAVYAFSHALNNLQKALCPGEAGICQKMKKFERPTLLKYLRNVSFQDISTNATVEFDKNGEVSAYYDILNLQSRKGRYELVRVGTWKGALQGDVIAGKLEMTNEKINWTANRQTTPVSFCSKPCNKDAIREPRLGFDFKCCWKCKTCEDLQIITNNTCHYGKPGWIPNANRSSWVKRPVIYMTASDNKALISIAAILIILIVLTIIIYVIYRNHRIVKASGRELCFVILAGICLCFLVPFLFVAKPNDPLCYARNLTLSIGLAMCYAPLFMKINRTYRIFSRAKSSVVRPPFVSPRMQLLLTFGLLSIQLMFTTLWFIAKPIKAVEHYYSNRKEIILECQVDKLSFTVNLGYVIVLMILCTAYGFKTRNFPKNFNESKYIGITMYVTCALWVLFFPFYLNTNYSFTHAFLVSGVCLLIGLITLIGLFAPKIYVIFFIKEITNDDLVMSRSLRRIRSEDMRRASQAIDNNSIAT